MCSDDQFRCMALRPQPSRGVPRVAARGDGSVSVLQPQSDLAGRRMDGGSPSCALLDWRRCEGRQVYHLTVAYADLDANAPGQGFFPRQASPDRSEPAIVPLPFFAPSSSSMACFFSPSLAIRLPAPTIIGSSGRVTFNPSSCSSICSPARHSCRCRR